MLTGQQEGDETRLLGQEEFEARAAEDVFNHGLRAAGALQERQELLRLLRVLRAIGGVNWGGTPWGGNGVGV